MMRKMRVFKKGQKGFTLIELLIVVAILGILAAVVVPNVGRFLGRGEDEARSAELHDVATAVSGLMVDNNITTIPNPIGTAPCTAATKDMTAFPDSTSVVATADKLLDPGGTAYAIGDANGYIMWGHDKTADAAAVVTTNYISFNVTKYFYTVETDGTIHQYDAAGGTEFVS